MDETFVWLVALALRATVVLSAALGLAWLLRRSSAAARHRLLTLTAVGLLALPALAFVLPRLEVPIGLFGVESPSPGPFPAGKPRPRITVITVASSAAIRTAPAASRADAVAPAPVPGVPSQREVSGRAAFGTAAVMVWLIGVVAALVGLGRALLREGRVLAASRSLSGRWLDTLDEVRRACAVARPVRLLVSDAIEAPLAGGWLQSAVILPAIADSWTADRRQLVLQHELVHVVRGDGLRRLAWRLVAALYWFHPLARIAERQARLIGEQACDEAVVGLGTQPPLYARHLVEIAEALRGSPAVFASALPMVERNQLERRVVMILDASHSSRRGRGLAIASLAILAATLACAAAAAPAAPAPAPQLVQEETTVGVASLDGSGDTDHHEESFQHHFGDGNRLNARIVGHVLFDDRTGAIRELPRGSSVLIETRRLGKGSQRMRITEEQGEPRYEWWLDGDARPVYDDARAWLKEAFEVVAAFRAIGSIQGHVGSLQGEIGSIQGQIGALQGRIGAIQGEEGSLQGKIGAIQGEQGSLQGQIGSHQGAISSLQSARGVASADLRKQLDREIQAHEAAIKKLEAEKNDGELARRLAEAEADLRAFQQSSRGRLAQAEADLRAFQQSSRGKIADLERQIDALRSRSDGEIGELEKEIDDLHADESIDEIKRHVAPRVDRLKALIDELGR